MKILVVNWRDINDPLGGGAELHLHEILKGCVAQGCEVDLVVSSYKDAPAMEVIDGIRIFRKGHWAVANFVLPSLLKKLLKENSYDLLVEDINKVPFYTPLYSGKVPVVAIIPHLFGATVYRETNPLVATYVYLAERLIPFVYKKAHFEVISPSTGDDLESRGINRNRITNVYCGMNRNRFKISDIPKRDESPLIVSWSRLRKYKSVDIAIKAFAIIQETMPDAKMLVMGKGPDENRLKKMTTKMGLDDTVKFTGHLPWDELVQVLHKTKVFLNPSPKEGWGLTVIEANCCGVPVVASDRPGLKDSVVDGQTGLLVPYGNPDAMAKAALEIIQNQTKFNNLSQAAKDWSEKFSWTKCADESLALFKKVIAEARS
jgi:glycosyltransferase involved in cell wall biosynthesis